MIRLSAACLAVASLCLLAGCGAFGRLDTAAMQTTNRAAGVPANGAVGTAMPPPVPATR